ncbi:DNA alkylation repair protein [Rhodococcoides kyotonense]|uniref:3-methyladenine DNA glycosylase AlkC n=1 Tax=Rhodococcoides kyotonense TaxID=398843 RepID=A0A239KIV9_9NOCA|nr:DNA alkylation repair protein [Rhodococcus kyotonensis]SNT18307.1 3-methyladenine DNA glycosylase AlkC [Rhodococcus kyotonensis]
MPTADELLGNAVVDDLRACLGLELSVASFDSASLSTRMRLVRDALLSEMPSDYRDFEAALRAALPDSRFTGWMIWPVTEALAVRATAAGKPEFDSGLELLAELTSRLTGEFAIRTFLDADLDRTLATAQTWTTHPDPHVRRLASEGTRPFLPWARRVAALTARPYATRGILTALYRDESEYVRRSVANHLNDLSRTDPELVVEQASAWIADPDENTPKSVRHALRTLVKKGHPDALALLGFAAPVGVTVENLTVTPTTVVRGESVEFTFDLGNTSASNQSVAIDYVIHHVRANGTRSPKVFKLTTKSLPSGSRQQIVKSHSFRPITTRRYYPGEHLIEVQVNGHTLGSGLFLLD